MVDAAEVLGGLTAPHVVALLVVVLWFLDGLHRVCAEFDGGVLVAVFVLPLFGVGGACNVEFVAFAAGIVHNFCWGSPQICFYKQRELNKQLELLEKTENLRKGVLQDMFYDLVFGHPNDEPHDGKQ